MSNFRRNVGRRLLSLAAPLLFSTLALAETAPSSSLPARIQLVTHDFPPFTYLQDGEVAGPVRLLIDRVCGVIGVQCQHRLLPWSRAQVTAQLGEADGMYVIGFNEPRSRWLRFSTPLLGTEYGFFVRGDNPLRYSAPQDLSGYRIGVYGPSNTSLSLERLRGETSIFETETSPDNEAAWRQLAAGRVDAVYSNREVGLAVMRRLELESLRYAGPARKLDYYVGFTRQTLDEAFNLAFSRAYKQLEAEGVVRDVLMAHGILPDH